MPTVKRKLTNKSLKEKCEIVNHMENGMTNKGASEKFGVPKNTISTWMKKKEKLFAALQETSLSTKIARCYNYIKVDNAVYGWFFTKKSSNTH